MTFLQMLKVGNHVPLTVTFFRRNLSKFFKKFLLVWLTFLFLLLLSYLFTFTFCGGLNNNDPHGLIDLNEFECRSSGSGTIRRCGIIGVSVALLEGLSLGVGFHVSDAQDRPSVFLSSYFPLIQI